MRLPFTVHWLAGATLAASVAACFADSAPTLHLDVAERLVADDIGPVRGVSAALSDGTTPDGVTWSVVDESVAAWSGDVLFAKAAGETGVVARWRGQEVRFLLVVDPPMRINFEDSPERVSVGSSTPLAVHGHRGAEKLDAGPATWRSTDPSRATVDANGVVTGLSAGTVWISAEAHGGTAMLELIVE